MNHNDFLAPWLQKIVDRPQRPTEGNEMTTHNVQPKTSAQRQSDHRERMREKGYKCCNIWVPEDRREELMEFAKKLCE